MAPWVRSDRYAVCPCAMRLSRSGALCKDALKAHINRAIGAGAFRLAEFLSNGFWNKWSFSALIAAVAAGTFAFDLMIPLGVAGGVPYVVTVLLGWWLPGKRAILFLAFITSMLTVVGYFLSPEGGIEWMVITNRGLAIFAIWVTALLLVLARTSTQRMIALQKKLKALVEDRTRKMEASEDRFRDYAEVSSDWFWEMDVDLKFTSFSGRTTAVEEMFPVAIGSTRWDALDIDPLTDPVWRAHHEMLLARKSFRNFVYSYVDNNGRTRWWQISGVPVFDEDNKFCGYRGSGSDISESKLAEAQLIQSSKLATLGEIASGITHELNQPLNIIQMSAESTLMRLEKGKLDEAQQATALTRIVGQVQRMSKIINHMRVFARQGEPEATEIFSPVALLDELLELLERQITASGVELGGDIPDQCGMVRGSPVQLEQVVMNLITNAVDAVRDHVRKAEKDQPAFQGRITVGLQDDAPNNQIIITVSDNGGGIPSHIRKRIFDPFFTTKAEGRGTGLGLSISYKIIEHMGGTLEVENTALGARFEILLSRIDPSS